MWDALNSNYDDVFSYIELINEGENFIAHSFKGKYLDCGTLEGYKKSSLEISKI